MKKFISVILAVIMLTTIGGCSGNSTKTSGDSLVKEVTINGYTFKLKTAKKPKDIEIAVVYMNVSDIFATYLDQGIKAFKKKTGINCYITGANDWTAESQYNVIENLITKKPDGIAIAAADDQTIAPIIKKGLEAGIPIICVNSDAPSSNRLAYLGRDDVEAGRIVAENIVKRLEDKYGEAKGNVLMTTTGAGTNWSDSREKGSKEIFAKYSKIKIVDVINATGDEQAAYGALENALLAHPDIDAMCNMGGTMDLWGRLMKNKNLKNIISVGNDLYGDVLTYIKDGYLTCSYGQRVYEQAYGAVQMLYDFDTTADPASFKPNNVAYYIFQVDSTNVDKVLAERKAGTPIG
jgi:ribose transport system substrate-binding protein